MVTTTVSTATSLARVTLNSRVKTWYLRTYPTDECGMEIDPHLTFGQLSHALAIGRDIYDTIGIGDSVICERCFTKLAEICHMTYGEIYNIWTTGRTYAH